MVRIAALIGLLIVGAIAPAQAQGRWLRMESPHFIVVSDHSEARVAAALERLEGFDALLRSITRVAPDDDPVKLEVYLFRGAGLLAEVRGTTSSGSIAGFYTASPAALAEFRGDRDLADHVLFHEYAHHFMLRYFPAAYPAWYVEGFAEYVATVDVRPDSYSIGRFEPMRIRALETTRWLPMERLLAAPVSSLSEEERQNFYAQSWLLVHYCANTPGCTDTLQRYFGAMRGGADPIAAFNEHFAKTPDALQDELRRYIRTALTYVTMARTPARTPLSVSRLSPGADDLLTRDLRLRCGVQDEDRAELIDAVRRRASGSDDPFALRTLARAEILAGDHGAARAALSRALAANPQDLDALYLMGVAYQREAEANVDDETLIAESRRHFVRAHRVDPRHAPTLYRFAMTFWTQEAAMPAERLDILVEAANLAPQVDEIGMNAAIQLAAHGRRDEAIAALRPIAYNPHGGQMANAARALLAELE
ncbi:MAG: hypothetical protein HXY28_09080 [Hydrogenophilaceae bacterium]|jgi:tetratricopeptide (TPR) repeat protein|nr:hypothetical protein [Hydrogenophilaceae bacterium]